MAKRKRPRDINQLAQLIVGIATGERVDDDPYKGKDSSEIRGRSGGLKGGKSRARKLSPEQRQEIARLAARARWKKSN